MDHLRRLIVVLVTGLISVLCDAPTIRAQTVEISPFYGYRLGGGISEITAGPVVDDDGGASFGATVDVVYGPPADGLKFEALYSHEETRLKIRRSDFDPPSYVHAQVDQIMAGGTQDLSSDRVRPFLSGLLGITRYSVPGDIEVRFAIGAGTGLKANLTRNIGLRLDARGYMTIVDLGGSSGVCGGGGCAIAFRISPTFQADLTAGLIVAF